MPTKFLFTTLDFNFDNNFMTHYSSDDPNVYYNYDFVAHVYDPTTNSVNHVINLFENKGINPARVLLNFNVQADSFKLFMDRTPLFSSGISSITNYTSNKCFKSDLYQSVITCNNYHNLNVMVAPSKVLKISSLLNPKVVKIRATIIETYEV